MNRLYDEIIDFIAGGSSPVEVARFQPSEEAREKVEQLIHREKEGVLSADETAELNHYLALEHLMRLAKARARRHVGHE